MNCLVNNWIAVYINLAVVQVLMQLLEVRQSVTVT